MQEKSIKYGAQIAAAIIIAGAVVVSSGMLSKFFIKIRKEKNLAVKGYAEQVVSSDIAKFYIYVRARGANLEEMYNALQLSKDKIVAKLLHMGFKEEEINLGGINHENVYKKNDKGAETDEFLHIAGNRMIEVITKQVELVSGKYRSLDVLLSDGVDMTTGAPEYFIFNLDRYKLVLLRKATTNGLERAKVLAENSGGNIGRLLEAKQGIIQITSPYSTETSYGGVYDTESLEKSIKVVVTLEYLLE
jgi:hypothetical protein